MFTRAEAANPTAAQTLREVRSLREVYSHAVASVRQEILAEVPEAVQTKDKQAVAEHLVAYQALLMEHIPEGG
jgi:hypothetical protein